MKSFQLLTKKIVNFYLKYVNQRLSAKTEYHYVMAIYKDLIIRNRIRMEAKE